MGEPEHADVAVIGLEPGGEYAAGTLAEAGPRVTGAESRPAAGECPYCGCVPAKMMIRAANLIAETRRVPGSLIVPGGGAIGAELARARAA
jgi:pyruvate/2-oxoglutarate dehydrogenase complex dihydrolipoamide dehydrogenase (E3) component